MSYEMTAISARLSGPIVFMIIWTTATLQYSFSLDVGDASKEVQQLRSSIERLNVLKQLMNAEQVRFYATIHVGQWRYRPI